MLFVVGIPAIIIYSFYFVGYTGRAAYVETFWSAGLLAMLLEPASARHKRIRGYILMGIIIFNIFIALYESLTLKELFPIIYDEESAAYMAKVGVAADEFRAHAFFSHPLTASLVTSMAFFLLYSMRPRFSVTAPTIIFLLIGLLAYGGRAALGVTIVLSALAAFYLLLAGLLRRNLTPNFVLSIAAAVIILPIVMWIVITQTTIGDRIADTLYFDSSAQVRQTQWAVFGQLNLQDWVFGISKDRLAALKYQIGLGANDTDIENFWILIFLDLGVIGFSVFLTIFLLFLRYLARLGGSLNGWLLVIGALIIDSSSNSLGVWTNDLMIEVAFAMAISGFRDYVPVRVAPRRLWALPVRRPVATRGSLAPLPGRLRSPGLQGAVTPRR